MLDRFYRFFTEMDSSAARAVWVAFGLFTVAGIVLTAGMLLIDLDQSGIAAFLRGLRDVWWAPLAVTATFVVLAFIGAPQVVLIAATVAVFTPSQGIVMSWVATMVSGTIGYILGRLGGAGAVSRLLGGRGARALGFIGKNGFMASLIIRLVPSGPFIIVNMALGAARIPSMAFLGGTGIGILPKIALVAFGAHGIGEMLKGENQGALMFFVLAAIIWALIAFVVRPFLARLQNSEALPPV